MMITGCYVIQFLLYIIVFPLWCKWRLEIILYIYIYIYVSLSLYIYVYTYIYIYIYTYVITHTHYTTTNNDNNNNNDNSNNDNTKGQMGSALMGSLRLSCFLQRDFLGTPANLSYISESARVYPFPQPVKIHYSLRRPR